MKLGKLLVHHPRSLFIALIIFFLGLGMFLRFYHRDQAMYYMNDQGRILLTAHEILFHHHAPEVGPLISLTNVRIPPLTYYFVAFMELFGTDPTVVSLGYIIVNLAAGLLLAYYAFLILDIGSGLWTLFLFMISASVVEIGRTIWEPHLSFSFVVFYLTLTEVAYRKKNIWLYGLGIFLYILSIALYPTPLLLLPFVWVRTFFHFRMLNGPLGRRPRLSAILILFGISLAVFGPWLITYSSIQHANAAGLFSTAVSVASPSRVVSTLYMNMSNAIHDLFQLGVLIPRFMVGSIWMKLIASGFIAIILTTLKRKTWLSNLRGFRRLGYHWLVIGFAAPALVGMKMTPHRLLPFYPFIFLFLAWWMRSWIRDKNIVRRAIVVFVVFVFVVGNVKSWYVTTIVRPRRDYVKLRDATERIVQDMSSRQVPVGDIGVHYFRPDDQYDYFAPSIYYLLRVAINYPVSYTPLGNELRRGGPETHPIAYVVCDGFALGEVTPRCLMPFLGRWGDYALIQNYAVAPMTRVVVFQLFDPGDDWYTIKESEGQKPPELQ